MHGRGNGNSNDHRADRLSGAARSLVCEVLKTFVILQSWRNEALCVDVCPADCIHPKPSGHDFMRAEMLHIDPMNCIDYGACVDACPVSAIKPDNELVEEDARYPKSTRSISSTFR
ncbi:4Fe-4S dicluster domain-containing protein [Rhodococcus opacus]|uniref:4Fe-4S dicluster domain-containing protein n=1 Tax=Rhodococcus opacus TaxID=37919 RepID=UPI000FFC0679